MVIAADPGHPGGSVSRFRIVVGSAAVAVAVWLLVGGWPGMALGMGAAVAAGRGLSRVEAPDDRKRRMDARADLPFAADLLAATLRSGAPTEHAARVVGTALGGPIGRDLIGVAAGLRLGLDPADAWAGLAGSPDTAKLADAFVRTVDSGAAVAGALDRLADAMRAASLRRVEAAAQRLSVLMVLPLGLCFLPAFVFAGVAPVIVAELGGVLR
jgi:Flp pilus assembly protein TadB